MIVTLVWHPIFWKINCEKQDEHLQWNWNQFFTSKCSNVENNQIVKLTKWKVQKWKFKKWNLINKNWNQWKIDTTIPSFWLLIVWKTNTLTLQLSSTMWKVYVLVFQGHIDTESETCYIMAVSTNIWLYSY